MLVQSTTLKATESKTHCIVIALTIFFTTAITTIPKYYSNKPFLAYLP